MATIPGVSDNELIRTTWGDAVADELNIHTVKKTGAQVMTGALTADRVFVTAAQDAANNALARRDYVDSQTPWLISTNTAFGNAPAGVTGVAGTLALPATAVAALWQVTWNYAIAGHSAGSEFRTRMINASTGTPLSISGWGHYTAGESLTGVHLAFFGPTTAGAPLNVGFQLEIASVGANTNIAGLCVAVEWRRLNRRHR